MAIKELLETGHRRPAGAATCSTACVDEFAENEDLPNTTNPDDWARISGKKGERIVYIRTLVSGKGNESGRAIDTATQHRPVPVSDGRSPRSRPASPRGGRRRCRSARSRGRAGRSRGRRPISA